MNTELKAIQTVLDRSGATMERIVELTRSVLDLPADQRDSLLETLRNTAYVLAATQHNLLCAGAKLLTESRKDLDVVAPVRAPALHEVIDNIIAGKQLSQDAENSMAAQNDLRTALESPDGYTNVYTDFSVRLRDDQEG
jgi:hypothetical protein